MSVTTNLAQEKPTCSRGHVDRVSEEVIAEGLDPRNASNDPETPAGEASFTEVDGGPKCRWDASNPPFDDVPLDLHEEYR